ncbi:MAG: hypothetical protein QW678_03595 [Candidatus Aenigmatarchaeota archaeon]
MVLGILKKSKEKEKKEDELDFLKDLESIKSEFLEKPIEKEIKEPLETVSFEQIRPLPLQKEEEKTTLVEKESIKTTIEKESPEIYVKLDNYKKVLNLLEKLKVKLKEIENLVNEIKSIKENEVNKLEEIKQRLEQSKENIGEVLENLK